MKECVFYKEWLLLNKNQFRLLAMIATNGGEFTGNYTDMCNYLSITPQSRNKNKIKTALDDLTSKGYIDWEQMGRTHHLKIYPKETEIKIPLELAVSIINHDYSNEEQVAWEQVLKVYIWITQNKMDIVTNKIIANEVGASESTVCSAKNVLENEYEAITKNKITKKTGDDSFRTLGQELRCCAWWKDIA